MRTELFAYGTLMLPEVLEAVLGRNCALRDATLDGFVRAQLRDRIYPGIAPDPAASVSGLLVGGLDGAYWELLDDFEGPEYHRRSVQVRVTGGGLVAAEAYVVAPAWRDRLTGTDWSLDEFRARHLRPYLVMCRGET